MKITIQCVCGNIVEIIAKAGKATMLKENLKLEHFCLIKDGNEEIRIWCDNCKSWVALRLD